MSQENTLTVGSGPMTIRRSLNNIVSALNIAQGKAAFNLRESAFVFSSLQKMNEFVNKYEKQEEVVKQQDVVIIDPKVVAVASVAPVSQVVSVTPVKNSPLPDINLADEENVQEIIEI